MAVTSAAAGGRGDGRVRWEETRAGDGGGDGRASVAYDTGDLVLCSPLPCITRADEGVTDEWEGPDRGEAHTCRRSSRQREDIGTLEVGEGAAAPLTAEEVRRNGVDVDVGRGE